MLAFLLSIADRSDHDKIIYVYNKFNVEMLAFARRRLATERPKDTNDDALDVVQNAFLKITKYIKSIDFTKSEDMIRAYVLTVVENEIRNYLNDIPKFEILEDNKKLISDKDFIDQIITEETVEAVVKEIKMLDEKYSLTMLYRFFAGMSVKQISAFMGVPTKTVYTRLERGKRLLGEAMKKYDV